MKRKRELPENPTAQSSSSTKTDAKEKRVRIQNLIDTLGSTPLTEIPPSQASSSSSSSSSSPDDPQQFIRYQAHQDQAMLLNYYATQLHLVFNQQEMDRRLAAAYQEQGETEVDEQAIIKDGLQRKILIFLSEIPVEFEIKLMEQFFKQFPRFNINTRTSILDKDSLPIILYDWNKQQALQYVLSKFQYHKKKLFGDKTLHQVMKDPPLYKVDAEHKVGPKSIVQQLLKEAKNTDRSLTLALLQAGTFAKTSREITDARKYAEILHNFFDEKHINQEVKKVLIDRTRLEEFVAQPEDRDAILADPETRSRLIESIRENIFAKRTTLLPDLSADMQIRIIKEFLMLYPDFNIQTKVDVIAGNTLPVILFECNQEHAMRYLLHVKPYDGDYEGPMGVSLNQLISKKIQQQLAEPVATEESVATRLG